MILRSVVIIFTIAFFAASLLLPNFPYDTLIFDKKNNQEKILSNTTPSPNAPVQVVNFQFPAEISAKAAVVLDAKTHASLFEKNSSLKHLPASTTKLMTALVALEKCEPNNVVTVKSIEEGGTQMGIQIGDNITVENLLYGLLINSGNDAAAALAASCSDSESEFITAMNQKAASLEMTNTHFVNSTGFDDNYQFSTALDLAKLSSVAISNPLISKIVKTKSTVVTDVTGTKTYYLKNINELLETVDGLEGIKTGQTEGSRENLITKTTRKGNSVVVVVLGSDDRFTESQNLIEWAYQYYAWPIELESN